MPRSTLLIATGNSGKLAELRQLLADLPVELVSLSHFPDIAEVPETGTTFAENAELKARGYAQMTGMPALADDSGLEVEALDGRPGVLSARYGGDDLGFDQKMRLVLEEMAQHAEKDRRARFVCSMALADHSGEIKFTAEGICAGSIAPEPLGTGGFGYDPIFIPDGYRETFGQLPETIKQNISHRSGAIRQIMPILRDFLAI